jgi:predicted AlkP superfamily pyrophosphatase or phosphodiesterase
MKKYLVILLFLCGYVGHAQKADENLRTLIVFFDGLRPDYITPELMPNVYALKTRGSYGLHHHSVFPTVTRVNASSYATGSYPCTHGLMGNTVYFPQVDKTKGLNTGDASELMRIAETTRGRLLTTTSLGELLKQAGTKLMVFSSGSTGQAYLQNHTVSGGMIVNPGLILPTSLRDEVIKTIGQPPASADPNTGQHGWATDALLHYGLGLDGPLVSVIWFSDPDGTAHSEGIGSPLAMQSIKAVDGEFGRIIAHLESEGRLDSYNIIISADHGFVSDVGTKALSDFLIKEGLKQNKASQDVVLADGAIYIMDHDKEKIRKIVTALQAQDWIGAIFTKAGKKDKRKGWVEGTLSFETIHWNHPERMADILVDYNWNDSKNAYGYEGASFSKGVAGHGGSSPYEIHIPLIACGPSFKRSYESAVPTCNVDIVPTILKIHGLNVPKQMDGRVMSELLANEKLREPEIKKEMIETSVKFNWGTYHLTLEQSVFGGYRYVDQIKAIRELSDEKGK